LVDRQQQISLGAECSEFRKEFVDLMRRLDIAGKEDEASDSNLGKAKNLFATGGSSFEAGDYQARERIGLACHRITPRRKRICVLR